MPPPRPGRRAFGSGRIDSGLAARARPVISTREQVLPISGLPAPWFPGGIRRGSVVLVDGTGAATGAEAGGASTLAVSLLGRASATGSWCAAVGLPDPGVVAMAELGIDLERLVFVPRPGAMWPEVTAELLQGVDLVLIRPPGPARPAVARRLAARARERRAVLVVLAQHGRWPEGPDVRLVVEDGGWHGVESGHGHLRARRTVVVATGRRAATRAVRAGVWLPGASGAVEVIREERCGEAEERCSEAVAGGVVPRSPAGGRAR
jgi:hypothetical protein